MNFDSSVQVLSRLAAHASWLNRFIACIVCEAKALLLNTGHMFGCYHDIGIQSVIYNPINRRDIASQRQYSELLLLSLYNEWIMNSPMGVKSGVLQSMSISCLTCGTRHDLHKNN